MVIQRHASAQVLAKRRVLYIGSSVPLETMDGLEAVQQPLRDRYPIGEHAHLQGIDSYLTVSTAGLQIQYIDDPDTIVFFPISTLTLCAAVRPVNAVNAGTGEVMAKFVSLNSDLAAINAKNPAIFTAITRREKGRKVLECHGFICASDQDALEIVKTTSYADQMKRQNGTIRNGPGSYRVINGKVPVQRVFVDRPASARQNVRLSAGEPVQSIVEDIPPEFYDSPPAQGYFYRPSNVQAKTFNVEKKEPPLSARSMMSGSYVQPAERIVIPPQPSPPSPPPPPSQPSPPSPPSPKEPEPAPIPRQQVPDSNTIPPPPPQQSPKSVSDTVPPQVPPLFLPQQNGIPPPPMGRPRMYVPRAQYFSPPPYARPMYYAPPPPPTLMGRPRFFSPPPFMRAPPYPYPYPYPMYPQFMRRRKPKRKDSTSPQSKSSNSRHSSPKSPRDTEETDRKRVPNGDADSESDEMFRPRTPPRDYDFTGEMGPPRKERLSRREEYEMRRNRRKKEKDYESPPRMMYSGYRPYYMYQPQAFSPYMSPDPRFQPRSSSVPPHLRYSSKDRKAENKKQKKNKKKGKKNTRPNGPYGHEDISLESASAFGGYTSEIPHGAYPVDGYYYYPPRPPRDFRNENKQFMSEKSFSRRLQEEQRKSKGKKEEYYPTAYELNDAQADERINAPDFTMY